MSIVSLLPTFEEASEFNVIRSLDYMFQTRTLTWGGVADQTLADAFSGIVVSFGDQIWSVQEDLPTPCVNFEVYSVRDGPLELGLSSAETSYLLAVSAWNAGNPSSSIDGDTARRTAFYDLLQIGSFVTRLMRKNYHHISLVDSTNTEVGDIIAQGWTGMSSVPGETHLLGRCSLLVESQDV